jgi:hypothetical protein
VSLIACTKSPKEGCLDQKADNYNKKSDISCCCSYSANIQFVADTSVSIGNYIYKLNFKWANAYSRIKMENTTPKLIPYQVINKMDSLTIKQGNVKILPGELSYIRF